MEDIRFIPTRAHAVLDYLTGALLIAAPWIFQFSDVDVATWISVGAGVALIAMSLLTNYELALAHVIPVHGHLIADAALGAFLALSPWLFGFGDEGTNAWLPFVLIGVTEIAVAAVSDPWPEDRSANTRERKLIQRAA